MTVKLNFLVIVIVFMISADDAKVIDLNSGWKLANDSMQITDIKLPSGVYTELEKNNVTESVLFSKNDVDLRWIGLVNWTYSLNFKGKFKCS